MNTDENNVVQLDAWPEATPEVEMTKEEYDTAMEELLNQVEFDNLGRTIAGVLELLLARAVNDGAFYLLTDNEDGITIVAANADADTIRNLMPDNFKAWDDIETPDEDVPPFDTNRDPGDEQDEPAPAS
jgi:hypothetical protein